MTRVFVRYTFESMKMNENEGQRVNDRYLHVPASHSLFFTYNFNNSNESNIIHTPQTLLLASVSSKGK